ncbi:MAG: LptA/OstA family protein [Parvularculales bacterium]
MSIRLPVTVIALILIEPFTSLHSGTLAKDTQNNSMGALVGNSLSGYSDTPIEIEADTLDINQNTQKATFTGQVRVTQNSLQLVADHLTIYYWSQDDSKADEDEKRSPFRRLEAEGNATVTPNDNQSAHGDWMQYEANAQYITMEGNVILRQGENVVQGERLEIDLTTGDSRMLGTVSAEDKTARRVRGLFDSSNPPTSEDNNS